MNTRAQQGQVTVETAVLFSVVVAALVAMGVYLQRGVQGGMKSNADSLGSQFSATDGWSQTTTTTQNSTEDASTTTTTQDQAVSYGQTLR